MDTSAVIARYRLSDIDLTPEQATSIVQRAGFVDPDAYLADMDRTHRVLKATRAKQPSEVPAKFRNIDSFGFKATG